MNSGYYTNASPVGPAYNYTNPIYVSSSAALIAALSNARGGETILLLPGTYDGVSINAVTPAGVVTVASADVSSRAIFTDMSVNNSARLVIRDVDLVDKSSSTSFDFRVQGSTNITLENVNLHGVGVDGADSNPLLVRGSSAIRIANSEIHNVRYGINMLDNDGVILTNNYFHDIRTDGIRGGGNSNVTISDNVFIDFRPAVGDHADAIQFWTTATTASVQNIRITGNSILRGDGGAIQGIFMGDEVGLAAKDVLIQDNLILGTLFHGIKVSNAEGLSVLNNTVVGYPDQLSWISVPDGGHLLHNSAQRYVVGGVSFNQLAGNEVLPASRDAGASLFNEWLLAHLPAGASPSLAMVAMGFGSTFVPDSIPTLVVEGTAGTDALRAALSEESILRGGLGNDSFYGQSPTSQFAVTMEGGQGNDTYRVFTNQDYVVELGSGGTDLVQAAISYTLTENVETLRMAAPNLVGTGNTADNRLIGSSGNDTLNGKGGNDGLQGLEGNDTLLGDAGSDTLGGGAGDDLMWGGLGSDTLSGGAGRDRLDGGDGNDRIEGGAGADTLTGGLGADTFIFRQADLGSTDVVTDYNPGQDVRISLSTIDADVRTSANEAFAFVGSAPFSQTAGEFRYSTVTDGVLLQGDVDGDGVADLSLRLLGLNAVTANMFVL